MPGTAGPADNQPLLWTGPRRGVTFFYSLARPARRVAGHRASSVIQPEATLPESDPIVVPELSVHVVTGEAADDPHGQGFSAIYAEITTNDPVLIDKLSNSKQVRSTITLRCAMLDAVGLITKSTLNVGTSKFVLSVEDLRYRKPKHFWEK
jgi:hypothetical protein